eukprot:5127016-Pleurochrysis_carterae.AAC.1
MVGLSIRFLVETILPDVDATFTSFENAELWQQGRWASAGFARATFHLISPGPHSRGMGIRACRAR